MRFFLFLLLNAILFLRPEDIFPELVADPGVYECVMILCLAVSLPRIIRNLTLKSLQDCPITVCVIGLQATIIISSINSFGTTEGFEVGYQFFKLVIYYLLMVSLITSPGKLRTFVYWLGSVALVLTGQSLLQYYGAIDLTAMAPMSEQQDNDPEDESDGPSAILVRLCAGGMYNNPNDLARILVVGIVISLYALADQRPPIRRSIWTMLWASGLGVFGYALTLTHSRGGFMSLMAAIGVLVVTRYGTRRSIMQSLIILPVLLAIFGGRQTDLTTSSGTAHHRIELWNAGFVRWQASPLLGVGMNHYSDGLRYAAHNSFVHGYTELGFIGGTFFLGAFYLAIALPYRTTDREIATVDGELQRFRPYLLAIIAGTIMGMTSSSRNYVIPTYLMLGLTAAHLNLTSSSVPRVMTRLSFRMAGQVLIVSLLSVACLQIFIRIALARG
jgi:putative inorganic carbon (hco3(-)) transporter